MEFFSYFNKDDIVGGVEAKIASWTFLPVGNLLLFCNYLLLVEKEEISLLVEFVYREWGSYASTTL